MIKIFEFIRKTSLGQLVRRINLALTLNKVTIVVTYYLLAIELLFISQVIGF